jgi:hypothetical protein
MLLSLLTTLGLSDLEETAALYSTFNTNHFLPEYEQHMIKASAMCAKSLAKYRSREPWEDGWQTLPRLSENSEVTSQYALLDQHLAYLSAWLETEIGLVGGTAKSKGRSKHREADTSKQEPFFVIMLFERMLTAMSHRANHTEKLNEAAIWMRYYRFMVRNPFPISCVGFLTGYCD